MPAAPLLTDHLDHWAAHRGTEWALAAVEFPHGDMTGSRRSLTWSRLRARALAVAARIARTARPGDRAALLLPQGLDYVAAFLGCLYAGVVAVPLFTPALLGHQGRLGAVLADAAPQCLLTDSATMPSVQAFADRYCREAVVIAVDRHRDATEAAGGAAPAGTPSTDPDSPAYLQYTSGSTRTPAGVVVSHRNIVANARQAVDAYVDGRRFTTAVGWLPLFHDMGLVLSVAAPLTGGFPSVLMDPTAFLYRPARWLRLLAQYPGALSAAPDFAYDYCARRVSAREAESLRLHRVKCLINGGEPVRWQTVQRFHEAFAASGLRPETHCPSYGLAEATVFVSADPPDSVPTHVAVDRDALAGDKIVAVGSDDPQAAHFVTCGTPVGQRILIADPETGALLPDGEVGEIRVQGPNVAAAYRNRPNTSKETFQARIPGVDGRWLRTGDLGAVHDGALPPGTSLYASLASTHRVVMACTIQATGVPGKIRKDLASICGQGTPVDRVIYFTVTAVPTRKRHDLIEEAARAHQVDLEIWDAAALALHLADYDLFYLAVQYLHLPSDLVPPRPDGAGELPDWYAEARRRWQANDEPARTLGDLVDLRAPLRHATFHDEARADLPEWIGHARALLAAAAGEHTALRARYEIVVATLRGLGDMHPADQLACDFFDTVTADDTLTDPGILEDAVVLLGYGFGALLRGLTALNADDLCGWQRLLADKTDRLLEADPPANAMAHLLAMRARLALHADMTAEPRSVPEDLPTVAEVTAAVVEAVEAGEPVPALQTGPPLMDLDTGMRILLRLGRHLDYAPLFPIEHTADLFDYLTPVLVDHPLYREVRDLLDQATDRVTGQTARGERAQSRGHALIKSGRLPQALQEIHEAKANWLRGETIEGGLIMLLLCARLYSELGLPIAAKQYALAAATAAKSAPSPELSRFVSRGIIHAAQYDRQAGNWISATRLFCIGLMAQTDYCDEPYNNERSPYVWEMMADQALTLRVAGAVRPGFVPLLRAITASVGMDTVIDEMLAPTADVPTTTEEAYAEEADAHGVGRPFSDVRPTRRYAWNALGVDWEITCPNERLSVLAAERYTAALQVFLGELATQDPLFLPGRVSVEIRADATLPHDQPAVCGQSAGRDINRWRLRLPTADPADLETEPSRLLTALIRVVLSQSLLSDEAFMHLVEQALAGGLWHKLLVGRPYDELADFLGPDDYQTMAALADPAVGAGTPRGQAKPAVLPARTGPGLGYEHEAALETVRNRYAVMLPIVRYTLPRLAADSGFRRTVTQLRQEGWRDWHLLTAIANAVGNHRAQQQGLHPSPDDSEEHRAASPPCRPLNVPTTLLFLLRHSRNVPCTHTLAVAAVSTARGFGLVIRPGSLDPQALLSVLGDRYGYWTDDIEHKDPFGRPGAEEDMA